MPRLFLREPLSRTCTPAALLHTEPASGGSTTVKLQGQRAAAVRMHVLGTPSRTIARRLEVREETVCRWLAEPAVQAEIAELRAPARAVAMRILLGAAVKAARVLVRAAQGRLRPETASMRLHGAVEILDRVGIRRSSGITHTVAGGPRHVAIVLLIQRRRARRAA